MAEIRHLENRHDVIFFCRGWSDLDKILQTGTEWHVDCDDPWCVEMETRCRIPIWQTFGQIQWHVIPEPRITLQGAATWWIRCHDSRDTCHIAGCSHLTKSFFAIFYLFLFLMQFRLWRAAAAFVSYPIHLLAACQKVRRHVKPLQGVCNYWKLKYLLEQCWKSEI